MLLSLLLERYLDQKVAEGLQPKTVSMYRDHLRRFIASLAVERRVLGRVAVTDVANFLSREQSRGMGITTLRARHRAIDIWFGWLSDQDDLGNPPNILRRVDGRLRLKPPRKPKHQPRRANIDNLKRVIDSIQQSGWIGLRDRAMLLLALDCGVRIGELMRLEVADVDVVQRVIHIHFGKGGKERIAPFTATTATAIVLYLMARPPSGLSALFLSAVSDAGDVRGALTITGAQQRLQSLCSRAGAQHINWHSIRHLFGTKAINDGIRVETVSLLMGHSDVSITRRIYAELLPETARAEYNLRWHGIPSDQ